MVAVAVLISSVQEASERCLLAGTVPPVLVWRHMPSLGWRPSTPTSLPDFPCPCNLLATTSQISGISSSTQSGIGVDIETDTRLIDHNSWKLLPYCTRDLHAYDALSHACSSHACED